MIRFGSACFGFACFFGWLAAGAPAHAQTKPPTRVSFVGDSITFGSGTTRSRTDAYPAQLARMLGKGYVVSNFGISGTTLLRKGDDPYQNSNGMHDALESKPDVVVIMLGTNDTKPQNWKLKDQFVPDYKNLIGQFRDLPTHPKIFVCLPPPVPGDGNFGINEEGVQEQIPMIRKIAEDEHVELIDNYAALKDHPEMLPDRVHPNTEGAGLLAKSVYRALTGKPFEGEIPAPATRRSN